MRSWLISSPPSAPGSGKSRNRSHCKVRLLSRTAVRSQVQSGSLMETEPFIRNYFVDKGFFYSQVSNQRLETIDTEKQNRSDFSSRTYLQIASG